ncbi:MAG: hypothetical protein QXK84_07085 [Nitrososphaerota archaeon]
MVEKVAYNVLAWTGANIPTLINKNPNSKRPMPAKNTGLGPALLPLVLTIRVLLGTPHQPPKKKN